MTDKIFVYEEASLKVGCDDPEAQDSPEVVVDENTDDVEEDMDSDEIDSDGEDESAIRKFVLGSLLSLTALTFLYNI